MTETIYQVHFSNEKFDVFIEYVPLENGLLDIDSVDIQPRPVPLFEQRQPKRRQTSYEDPSVENEF